MTVIDAVSVHNILQLDWFYCYLFFIYSYILFFPPILQFTVASQNG